MVGPAAMQTDLIELWWVVESWRALVAMQTDLIVLWLVSRAMAVAGSHADRSNRALVGSEPWWGPVAMQTGLIVL